MKTLTIVCPVYNEEDVILAFHEELAAVLAGLAEGWQADVIYVVDRSSDRTPLLLRALAARDPRVRVLLLSSRYGQQAALLAGLDHADADAVVMMDGDLQHPPAVIPALLAEFEKGAEVVYTVREESAEIPWPKRVAGRVFYRLLNGISETPIHQGAADFRLISRRVLRVFQRQIGERSVFLRGLFNWVGFRSAAVRFHPARRRAGRSKYSLRRMLEFAADGIVSFSRTPLRAALLAGLGSLALAAAWALQVLVALLHHGHSPSPSHLVALLLLVLCGLQLMFLGILGEYLGRVLDEVKARPRDLVEERINCPAAPAAPPREPSPPVAAPVE